MWPGGTKDLNFNLYFILINLDIISHIWLMATEMDRAVLQDSKEDGEKSSRTRHPARIREPG